MTTKICTKCNEEKVLTQFHKLKHGKYGRHSICMECRKKYDNSEKRKAKRREYMRRRGYTEEDKYYYAERRVNQPEWYLHQGAKRRAKQRGIEFTLNIDDIIIPGYCPVLGIKLEMTATEKKYKANDNSPSIDRIDSTKGYHKDNIAIISYRANIVKNSGTAEEHRKIAGWMEKINVDL